MAPKEFVIQDKIHLLMEETGCDQGQAELAITLAGYDLEKAIRTIGTLLRNIVVVKGKFQLPAKNLYGLLILIADTRRERLFRIRAVVSYNPALYETPLNEDWYDFEKGLYAFRLWEGTLQQMTQDLERILVEALKRAPEGKLYDLLREGAAEKLRASFEGALKGFFSSEGLGLEILREELNLDQFRRFKTKEEGLVPDSGDNASPEPAGESLILNVDLQQASDGVPARDVRVGDSVFVLLTDNRDIAQYLSKLLGGRSERGVKPLVSPVEEIRREGDQISFQVRLSVGILGVAIAQSASLLRVQRRSTDAWWRRLLPF
jgi:hypothetical protein